MRRREFMIVGGGASGALLAIQLLRRGSSDDSVVLVDPSPRLGRGVAYSTTNSDHLLNVPAIGMSALADQPEHFQRWADCKPGAFIERQRYGTYLEELLASTAESTPATMTHHKTRAARLMQRANAFNVVLEDGTALQAGTVIVATGIEHPAVPRGLRSIVGHPRVTLNPWAHRTIPGAVSGARVGIVGSGLTGVDVALSILRSDPTASVTMISRHGRLPKRHEYPWRPRLEPPIFNVDTFLRQPDPCEFAHRAITEDLQDWRRRLDSLRPITQELWIKMSAATRETFLTKYRHLWDRHRHRIPAQVGEQCDRWMRDGSLRLMAGEVRESSHDADVLTLRVEGEGAVRDIAVDMVILATGPDPNPEQNPFLAMAIHDGLARPGPLGVGLDTDEKSARILDRAGQPQPNLYAIGPVRRGTLWESMAISEIRAQAHDLAEGLLA